MDQTLAVDAERSPTRRAARRVLRRIAATVGLGLIIVNVAIAGLSLVVHHAAGEPGISAAGIDNLRFVDDRVLRGDAPTEVGYRELARTGVTTVVDLRAERNLDLPVDLFDDLGLEHVALPIRDGQTPTEDQVHTFLAVVARSRGGVYLHCGAGVGRTGAMAAAYAVATGQQSRFEALRNNLAVGPPSVEQIYYAAFLRTEDFEQPPAPVKWVSRVIDGPRRLWSRYGL